MFDCLIRVIICFFLTIGKSLKTVSAFQMKPSSTPKQNQHPGQSTSSSSTTLLNLQQQQQQQQHQRPSGPPVAALPPQQPQPSIGFQPSWTREATGNQPTLPPKGGAVQGNQMVAESAGDLSAVPQITIIADKEEVSVSSEVFRLERGPILFGMLHSCMNRQAFTNSATPFTTCLEFWFSINN